MFTSHFFFLFPEKHTNELLLHVHTIINIPAGALALSWGMLIRGVDNSHKVGKGPKMDSQLAGCLDAPLAAQGIQDQSQVGWKWRDACIL